MPIVAKRGDVPNFGKKVVTVAGKDILLVNVKGTIYAVENECPHQGCPMSGSIVKDGHITCPRHGWHFSLGDGSCADHPEFTLALYPTRVDGDDIVVDIP